MTIAVWWLLRNSLVEDSLSTKSWGDFERWVFELIVLALALFLVAIAMVSWFGRPTIRLRWYRQGVEYKAGVIPLHFDGPDDSVFLTLDVTYQDRTPFRWVRTRALSLEQRQLSLSLGRNGLVDMVIEEDTTGSVSLSTGGLSGLEFTLAPLSSDCAIARPKIEVIAVARGPFDLPVDISLSGQTAMWKRPLYRVIAPVKRLSISTHSH